MVSSPEQGGIPRKTGIDKLENWATYIQNKNEALATTGIYIFIEVVGLGFLMRIRKKSSHNAVPILGIQRAISFVEFAVVDETRLFEQTDRAIREVELAYATALKIEVNQNGNVHNNGSEQRFS